MSCVRMLWAWCAAGVAGAQERGKTRSRASGGARDAENSTASIQSRLPCTARLNPRDGSRDPAVPHPHHPHPRHMRARYSPTLLPVHFAPAALARRRPHGAPPAAASDASFAVWRFSHSFAVSARVHFNSPPLVDRFSSCTTSPAPHRLVAHWTVAPVRGRPKRLTSSSLCVQRRPL